LLATVLSSLVQWIRVMIRPMLECTQTGTGIASLGNAEKETGDSHATEQRLRAQYNTAAAISAAIQGLIEGRKARGGDWEALSKLRQRAETKKEHLHARLAELGRAEMLSARGGKPR
jgi:hypothetical protein